MKVTRRSRLQTRAQNVVFVVLLLAVLGLLAWLSTVYVARWDWSYGHRNTLSASSRKVLATLSGPVRITAFATSNDTLRRAIRTLVGKYQRVDHDVHLKFVDPNTAPDEVRSLGITRNGELVVNYRGRSQTVAQRTESALTNALARVGHAASQHVVFVTGHGEMSPKDGGKFGMKSFAGALRQQGFHVSTLNLATSPHIPPHTAVLVIAGPQTDYLPGEVRIIRQWVRHGGNLLWLDNPDSTHGLGPLASMLHLSFPHGTIVDSTSPMFGVHDVRWLVLTHYGHSPITQGFDSETLFPGTTAVDVDKRTGHWRVTPFIKSRGLPRSWLETGKLQGQISYNPQQGDQPGPLNVAVSLSRPLPESANGGVGGKASGKSEKRHRGRQRVVVVGDAYFLANAYVSTAGNRTLGLNIVNWLSHDDRFINIHPVQAPDRTLVLGAGTEQVMVYGYLVLLPLLLLAMGMSIWLRRRRG